MRVKDLLKMKGQQVMTTAFDASVAEVASALRRHRIGAVVVTDSDEQLCGIVSERDLIQGLAVVGSKLLAMRVDSVMTRDPVTCAPDENVASLMKKMTRGKFRHLPVVDGGELRGIISIGDVVKCHLDGLEAENQELQAYITGAGVIDQEGPTTRFSKSSFG